VGRGAEGQGGRGAGAIQASAKKYKYRGYNKAALAFVEAGGNDTKNPRCKAVEAVIAIFPAVWCEGCTVWCYLIPSF